METSSRPATLLDLLEKRLSDPNSYPDEALLKFIRYNLEPMVRELQAVNSSVRPEAGVMVPRSLAERTEAMFRSVDPEGSIAQEWGRVLLPQEGSPK